LSETQRKWIQTQIENGGFDPVLQYSETLRRQQDSLRTLASIRTSALTPAQAQAEIVALIGRSITSPDATYRRYPGVDPRKHLRRNSRSAQQQQPAAAGEDGRDLQGLRWLGRTQHSPPCVQGLFARARPGPQTGQTTPKSLRIASSGMSCDSGSRSGTKPTPKPNPT